MEKLNNHSQSQSQSQSHQSEENLIPIDGFKQIVEMLEAADPQFRESLLRRLAARDQNLARSLRRDLKI